jgi:hypothetical protein
MVVAVGRSAKQLVNGGRRGKMWQRGGVNLSRFLRRIWRSVNRVCEDSAVVFAARSILIAKGVGAREDDDGRTRRRRRRMSCEGCLVRSKAENRFEACIVCTMLSMRRAISTQQRSATRTRTRKTSGGTTRRLRTKLVALVTAKKREEDAE